MGQLYSSTLTITMRIISLLQVTLFVTLSAETVQTTSYLTGRPNSKQYMNFPIDVRDATTATLQSDHKIYKSILNNFYRNIIFNSGQYIIY